jgi:hypothetical protein
MTYYLNEKLERSSSNLSAVVPEERDQIGYDTVDQLICS